MNHLFFKCFRWSVCGFYIFYGISFQILAQPQKSFDILNYHFQVRLEDTTDAIQNTALIKLALNGDQQVNLDLASISDDGKSGMQVSNVWINDSEVDYTHVDNKLSLAKPVTVDSRDTIDLKIKYSGVPNEGLIISNNKFGNRTFFAEHWPNRAFNWLPVVDHPIEKATCQFTVTAPEKYQVVANGDWQGVIINNGYKTTIWQETKPIPAKVMVIGVADFKRQYLDADSLMSIWTYPEDASNGLVDFEDTPEIYAFLTGILGEYPYSKLDQVQSKTRFGGMENAGNIFYPENRIDGTKSFTNTIAHEIAHQWFGNCVTESDWEHVWLSEGFATFLTYWYVREFKGLDALKEDFADDEKGIRKYQSKNPSKTILQSHYKDPTEVLSPLTYPKAGRVLWMLKHEIGDENMRKVLQAYYQKFKHSNASTTDFVEVVNEVTSKDYTRFFNDWMTRTYLIDAKHTWKHKNNKLEITITQKTPEPYQFQLDLGIKYSRMTFDVHKVYVTERTQTFVIETKEKPLELDVDPLEVILGNIK